MEWTPDRLAQRLASLAEERGKQADAVFAGVIGKFHV